MTPRLKQRKAISDKVLNILSQRKTIDNIDLGSYQNEHRFLALYNRLIENDLVSCKNNYSTIARLVSKRVVQFNDRLLDYDLTSLCDCVLSDDLVAMQKVSNLKYHIGKNSKYDLQDMVLSGEETIWCNSVQMIIQKDWESLKRNIDLIEKITLPKKTQNPELMEIDFNFYQAILDHNKSDCKELIKKLVSPKFHKKRNSDPILSQHISQPALGYTKLAWLNGLEIEIDNPLIPYEMLPFQPNEAYPIPYDFLKQES